MVYSEDGDSQGLQQHSEQSSGKSNTSNREDTSDNIALMDYGSMERKIRDKGSPSKKRGFRVYWQRWIMLMYMSVLNLLVRSIVVRCDSMMANRRVVSQFRILFTQVGLDVLFGSSYCTVDRGSFWQY